MRADRGATGGVASDEAERDGWLLLMNSRLHIVRGHLLLVGRGANRTANRPALETAAQGADREANMVARHVNSASATSLSGESAHMSWSYVAQLRMTAVQSTVTLWLPR